MSNKTSNKKYSSGAVIISLFAIYILGVGLGGFFCKTLSADNSVFLFFLVTFTLVTGIAFIFTYARRHDTDRQDERYNFEYTTHHRSYDLTLCIVAATVTFLSCFAAFDYHYGETEKPIEQLNGFYLGEHYNPEDIELDGITVYEGGEDDGYSFYTVDDERPSLRTYVIQNERDGVTKVVMSFGKMEYSDKGEIAEKLEEQLINNYGGKSSITRNLLHHGDRSVNIWIHHDGVSVSIEKNFMEEDAESKAQRESLSIELRMIDALAK